MLRIRSVEPLPRLRLRLTLTDGSVVVRDVERLLRGPVFDPIHADPSRFDEVRVEGGTAAWPWGADLDPDVLIWGGPAPTDLGDPPSELVLETAGARHG